METEKEKMLAGLLYNPADEQLVKERTVARMLLREFNNSDENQSKFRSELLMKLIPNSGKNLVIQPPFYCDYGSNIEAGDDIFLNFNCIILDVARVKIGSRTMMGPAVQIYSASHPMDFKERSAGLELGSSVTIGDDVWLGGNVTICPGVSIGDRTVVGAGSVVIRSIPAGVFAAGNPCRIIRSL